VAFKSKLDLPFRLLADEGGEVRKEWGVPKDLLGLLEGRQTCVALSPCLSPFFVLQHFGALTRNVYLRVVLGSCRGGGGTEAVL